MLDAASQDPAALAAELLACPADGRVGWLTMRRESLSLQLIEALKRYSDPLLTTDPIAADDATRCALLLAQHLPDETLALPLASWARGNWQAYHDPHAATRSYRQALEGYRAAGDDLSVARLLSNLVFAYCDCGLFAKAQRAYAEAHAILSRLGPEAAAYLLHLELNYGWLLHNQGRYEEALVTHERALLLAHRFNRPDKVTEIEVNRAFTLGMSGRLREAEAALLRSREVAEQDRQALTVARIDMNLGVMYAAQGRPAEALRRFQAARERFTALGNQMEIGTVLLWEAALFERIGALAEARRSYTGAQGQFTALQMWPWAGMALVYGAATSRRYGEYAQAAQLLDDADALWRSLDQPLWRAEVLFERAALALAQDDPATALALLQAPRPIAGAPALEARREVLLAEALLAQWQAQGEPSARDEAERLFTQALNYARQNEERWMQRQALAGLGRLAFSDDRDAAQSNLQAAVEIDDEQRQVLSVEELKAGFQTHAGDLPALLARLMVERGRPRQALGYAWHAKGSALLDLLRAGDERLPDEQDEINRARQQLATYRWSAALQAGDNAPESLRERGDPMIKALEQRLSDLRRTRNRASPGGALPADPTSLLGHMDADLLIEYLRCDDALLVLLASRDGDCRSAWLGEVDALLDLHDELRLSFQNVLLHPDGPEQHMQVWLDECRPLLRRCYELLLAPLGRLPTGARLLIAPCDPLYLFPFAAFWDGRQYLVERHEIQMTPTGALLAAPPPAQPAAPLIVAASGVRQLAAVLVETAAVQAALPGSVCLIDDPGTIGYLRSLRAPPRILHIAAHSVLREDAPIFSALQLPGAHLSVEQCFELPLRGTELVVLSGCTTGGGLESGGALLAFQSAFFAAGARQVLSSLWPIEDAAAAAWMARFYQFLAAGLPAPAALRETQQALLADHASGHPAIWAAFACSTR